MEAQGQDWDVFMRMRERISVPKGVDLTIGMLAEIVAPPQMQKLIEGLPVRHIGERTEDLLVISTLDAIRAIKKADHRLQVRPLGQGAVIVIVEGKKPFGGIWSHIYFILVWILLFIGSGMALMNFHADVSMADVHRVIYRLLTGEDVPYPLMLQVPYSIGVGLGMAIFFNQLSRRNLAEPSPLEVEIDSYQENVNKHIIHAAEARAGKEEGN
ncbi:MAG: stage V sporulation protein AA [Limnochordia bacterium]